MHMCTINSVSLEAGKEKLLPGIMSKYSVLCKEEYVRSCAQLLILSFTIMHCLSLRLFITDLIRTPPPIQSVLSVSCCACFNFGVTQLLLCWICNCRISGCMFLSQGEMSQSFSHTMELAVENALDFVKEIRGLLTAKSLSICLSVNMSPYLIIIIILQSYSSCLIVDTDRTIFII